MDSLHYLAGDIGGTKTYLALFTQDPSGAPKIVAKRRYLSAEFATLTSMCESFLAEHSIGARGVRRACFALPGAVIDGHCETTNLPWVLDETVLARQLGCERVLLLNDLQATAYGSLFLAGDESVEVQQGVSAPHATIAVLAAGTGMGQSALVSCGGQYVPLATEGGHSSFAPQTEREFALREFIANSLAKEGHGASPHVSVERVVSGPGLARIYEFLCHENPSRESMNIRALIQAGDPSEVIGRCALATDSHPDPLCVFAVKWFVSMLAAEASNVALKHLARGGVVLAGGVCAKLLPAIKRPEFLSVFAAKGRFAGLLRQIPIRVLLNEEVGLLGAMRYAMKQES